MRAILTATALTVLLGVTAGTADAKTLPGFRSPSGNISCLLVTDKPIYLNCDIKQADYSAKLVHYCGSAPFEVDWGGFSLGTTHKAGVICTGGIEYDPQTEHPKYVTLAYGKTWSQSGITCKSETVGVTCTNKAGRSLFISRASYRLS